MCSDDRTGNLVADKLEGSNLQHPSYARDINIEGLTMSSGASTYI